MAIERKAWNTQKAGLEYDKKFAYCKNCGVKVLKRVADYRNGYCYDCDKLRVKMLERTK
jgi:hypothetical protein